MIVHRILPVTTDGDGNGSVTNTPAISGRLVGVKWVVGTFAAGVDAVLSTVDSEGAIANLLTLTDANAEAMYYPRHVVHSEAGAALTGTAGGDREAPLVFGHLKLVVSSGGATKTGRVICFIETNP